MPFTIHPDRKRVINELHLRRMPALSSPCRLVQLLRLVDPSERDPEDRHVDAIPDAYVLVQRSERHMEARHNSGATLLWERHSEATTATLMLPGASVLPFGHEPKDALAMQWLVDAPGSVLRATKILVVDGNSDALKLAKSDHFQQCDLLSTIVGGGGQFWSDFRIHPDDFGHLIVAANGMPPGDLGRVVQRFQELGNYRNLVLLGLLSAQQHAGELSVLESELLEAVPENSEADVDSAALDRLVGVAARASKLSADMTFRLSATAAYTEIVLQRLESLSAKPVAGFQSLHDFVERRLLPASRTCASFDARLERLHRNIERATAQLRTRIELRIQKQNSAMLTSMENSSKRQLQLQHMVEGLSVVAISYYAVGLFAYVAKGAGHLLPGWDVSLLITFATIPLIAITWVSLRLQVKRANEEANKGGTT